jgi:uncharacterized protein
MNNESLVNSSKVKTAVVVFLTLASLLMAVSTISAVKGWNSPADKTKVAEITVQGKGEAFAVPDIATFNYTVSEDGATVKAAQDKATPKMNAVLEYLKGQGIAEKDIKTSSYDAQPKYDYSNTNRVCPAYSPCPPGTPVIVGYTVSQTIEVKVRDTTKAGDILSGVGSKGVKYVSGLQFTIDDEDKIVDEAREQAIADAKEKAEQLAKDLGVSLVRITSFGEDRNGYPIFYRETAAMNQSMDAVGKGSAAPAVPTGENKVTSNVTITYEVR